MSHFQLLAITLLVLTSCTCAMGPHTVEGALTVNAGGRTIVVVTDLDHGLSVTNTGAVAVELRTAPEGVGADDAEAAGVLAPGESRRIETDEILTLVFLNSTDEQALVRYEGAGSEGAGIFITQG